MVANSEIKELLKEILDKLENYMTYPTCLECQMNSCMNCHHEAFNKHSELFERIELAIELL